MADTSHRLLFGACFHTGLEKKKDKCTVPNADFYDFFFSYQLDSWEPVS